MSAGWWSWLLRSRSYGAIVLRLFLFFAVLAIVAAISIFGRPAFLDPDAWRIRRQLAKVAGVRDVSMFELSEWSGSDEFAAEIELEQSGTFLLRRVDDRTATAPRSLVLQRVGPFEIRCSARLKKDLVEVKFGIEALASRNRTLAPLAIASLADVVQRYGALYDIAASLQGRGREMAMDEWVYHCVSSRKRDR